MLANRTTRFDESETEINVFDACDFIVNDSVNGLKKTMFWLLIKSNAKLTQRLKPRKKRPKQIMRLQKKS